MLSRNSSQSDAQLTSGLLGNPFELLRVSLTAKKEEIAAAFEDALSDGVIPDEILREARRQLLAPKLRLTAEISFLPDSTGESRNAAILALRMNAPFSDLLAIAKDLPPISRASFLSHLGVLQPSAGILRSFAIAQAEIDPEEALDILVIVHEEAGMPRPNLEAVAEALNAESGLNSERLFTAFRQPIDAANSLRQCLEEGLSDASSELIRSYTGITNAYAKAVSPQAQAFHRQIEDIAEKLKSNPNDSGALEEIQDTLQNWDELAQPQQILALQKGRDEPYSRGLFEFLRDLSMELANERDAMGPALEISRICASVFAELPRATLQLEEDIAALESLVDQVGAKELLRYVESVRKDLYPLVDDLNKNGFSRVSTSSVRHLYELFDQAVSATEGSSAADLPWVLLRGLAIDINNDLGEGTASEALVRGLQSHSKFGQAPAEIKSRIQADLKTVRSNVLQTRLTKAVTAKDHSGARQTLLELLAVTDDAGEKRELQQALVAIDGRRRGRYIKFGIWAVFAIGIWAVASNQGNDRNYNSSRTYTPPSTRQSSSAPTVRAVSKAEVMPLAGTNRTLNRENIRYCLYSEVRLDAINTALNMETDNGVITKFNMAIDDYNSRCTSYKYYPSNLTAVQSEVKEKRKILSAQGIQMLKKWRAGN